MASDISGLARALILMGALLAGAGVILLLAPKAPWIGRLPGDIVIERARMTFYFPLASCLVASLLLSLLLWVVGRFR